MGKISQKVFYKVPTVVLVRTQEQFDNVTATFESNKKKLLPYKTQMVLILPEDTKIATGEYDTLLVGSVHPQDQGEIIPGLYVLLS